MSCSTAIKTFAIAALVGLTACSGVHEHPTAAPRATVGPKEVVPPELPDAGSDADAEVAPTEPHVHARPAHARQPVPLPSCSTETREFVFGDKAVKITVCVPLDADVDAAP
jgi:hypothetical protein